jgi:hypothetical protein
LKPSLNIHQSATTLYITPTSQSQRSTTNLNPTYTGANQTETSLRALPP